MDENGPKMAKNGPKKWPKMGENDQQWAKMGRKCPKMVENGREIDLK